MSSNNISNSTTQGRSNEEEANSKPPKYDQSVRLQYRTTQGGLQMQHNSHFNQGVYQQMVPMNTAWPLSDPSFYQTQFIGTGNIPSREESQKEKKDRMKHVLMKRNIPQDLWTYYVESPERWNYEDTTEPSPPTGLKKNPWINLLV